MAKQCEVCNEQIEAFREHTNLCEKCAIEFLNDLTPEQLQQRYNWF
jgi:hypothetical protein